MTAPMQRPARPREPRPDHVAATIRRNAIRKTRQHVADEARNKGYRHPDTNAALDRLSALLKEDPR